MGVKDSSTLKKSLVLVVALVAVAAIVAALSVAFIKPRAMTRVTEERREEELVVDVVEKEDSLFVGKLRIKNGLCAHVGADERLYMRECQGAPVARLSPNSHMRLAVDKCMTVHEDAYLMVEKCDETNDHQSWVYDAQGRLRNTWSNYCAMHVTNPDHQENKQQIVMAQPCEQTQAMDFLTWTFQY